MARQVSPTKTAAWTVAAWAVGLIIFFPILWTVLTSLKSEDEAIASPPQFLYLHSSLSDYLVSYHEVFTRGDGYWPFFMNSVIISLGSTLLALAIAIPSAWAMAFAPGPKTKDLLMWMLSTKMMPAVGALIPIFLVFRDWGMLNNTFASLVGMVIVLALINLPIVIWMLYTYFKEIPNDILEAGRMDGASLTQEILYILTPMAVPGIASTLLLNFILAWNEAFWTLNITSPGAQPLTAFIGGYSSPEGLFYAKLSAASTLAIAPILIIGWFSQKQLVRGLTFGAVK